MWSQMVYQNVKTIYLPKLREWPELPEWAALTVYMTKGGILAVCRDKIVGENCSEMNVLTRNGVDSLCLHCIHSISCSIEKRERDDKFEPDSDELKHHMWTRQFRELLTRTTEVPFLALLEDLPSKLQGRPFEIEFVSDVNNLRFDLYRLRKNLKILMNTEPGKLVKYGTILEFVEQERSSLVPGKVVLQSKLEDLMKRLERYELPDFSAAIETMQL